MKFVHPEFLWALTALAIPIVIHLFNFRRYKTLYFSSLQFVQKVNNETKSTQKLKHWIILALRLLAYAAIILAFAQPFFDNANSIENETDKVYAIHIDNSQSMTMRGAEGELLSEAKEAARRLISSLPLDAKILISTNAFSGIEARITNKIDALNRLDEVNPTPLSRSIDDVVLWQKNFLSSRPEYNSTSIQHIYLSDFQRKTTNFSKLNKDSLASYYPYIFVPQEKSNLSIDSVWFTSPLRKVGVSNELNISVTNHGEKDLKNLELSIEIGTLKKDLFIDINGKSKFETKISYTDESTGYKKGKIRINDSQFFSDDDFYIAYEVRRQSNILIINGDNNNESMSRILSLEEYYDVKQINQGSVTSQDFKQVDLVILNGLNEIKSGFADDIVKFTKNGGSIAIFPGANLNLSEYNDFLLNYNLPLISKKIQQNTKVAQLNYDDSFFKGVFDNQKENLSLPGVSQFYLTNETSTSNSYTIMKMQNGRPLLLRSSNQNSAFFFTGIIADQSSFTSDILYPTLLLRMSELSQRSSPLSITLGGESIIPLFKTLKNSDQAVHLKNESHDFIPSFIENNNSIQIDLQGNEAIENLSAGNYNVTIADEEIAKVGINYNRTESDLAYYSFEEVNEKLLERGITNFSINEIKEGVSALDFSLVEKSSLWKIILIAGLIFLILEMILIKFWK